MARPKQGDLIRTNVHIGLSQLAELDKIAEQTMVPRNTQIRQAVEKYLASERRKTARAS